MGVPVTDLAEAQELVDRLVALLERCLKIIEVSEYDLLLCYDEVDLAEDLRKELG